MTVLDPGDLYPAFTLPTTTGRTLTLPDDLAGRYGVVLVNRGSWCPYCVQQLTAFQRALPDLEAAGVTVVSFSVDDAAAASRLAADKGLTFPVGHSADAAAVHEAVGAFVNPDPVHLQSTGFVLDPGGRVIVSVYSSGAIGRLVPADVLGLVRYHREHAAGSAA